MLVKQCKILVMSKCEYPRYSKGGDGDVNLNVAIISQCTCNIK